LRERERERERREREIIRYGEVISSIHEQVLDTSHHIMRGGIDMKLGCGWHSVWPRARTSQYERESAREERERERES